MFNLILRTAMEEKHVSAREVARQTGVAHTTIIRILQHENVDLDTIKKVCGWLKIDPMYVVNLDSGQEEKEWLWKVGMMVESNTELHIAMKRVFKNIDHQEINPRIINEICEFIAFAITMHRNEIRE
jgi:DNA-binding Xre family transcriptional regulator